MTSTSATKEIILGSKVWCILFSNLHSLPFHPSPLCGASFKMKHALNLEPRPLYNTLENILQCRTNMPPETFIAALILDDKFIAASRPSSAYIYLPLPLVAANWPSLVKLGKAARTFSVRSPRPRSRAKLGSMMLSLLSRFSSVAKGSSFCQNCSKPRLTPCTG